MCGTCVSAAEIVNTFKVNPELRKAQFMHPDSNEKDRQLIDQFTKPDPSSHANFDIVKMDSFDLDVIVDFENTKLVADVKLNFTALVDAPKVIVLDINKIDIKNISFDGVTDNEFWISRDNCPLGQALVIPIPASLNLTKGNKFTVTAKYATSSSASALQWMDKEQTIGKEHPFVFALCQAVHARSLIPLQDSPGAKCTFTSRLSIPAHLNGFLSAVKTEEAFPETEYNGIKYRTIGFVQETPMPTYIFTVCVGNLAYTPTSGRTGIYSEPEIMEACVAEFSDLEAMVTAAEKLIGKYYWNVYNVAILNLNYGGMETACTTLLTNSLIAGDKSLVNVILHELAHSWFGNLVTCNTWEHFWLNEGLCVYHEQQLISHFEGPQSRDLQAIIGWADLKESVTSAFARGVPEHTRLIVPHDGDIDPDDVFSSVPYFAGSTFVRRLRERVGEEVMSDYFKAFVEHFKFESIDSFMFRSFFMDFMSKNGVDKEILDSIEWDVEFHREGMPPIPVYDYTLAENAYKNAEDLSNNQTVSHPMEGWNANQVVVMLDKLVEAQEEALAKADAEGKVAVQELWKDIISKAAQTYDFENTRNAELRFRYITLKIRSGIEGAELAARDMLLQYGRMKFVRPLFRDMFKSKKFREFAFKFLEDNANIYHPTTSTMVGRDKTDALNNDYAW